MVFWSRVPFIRSFNKSLVNKLVEESMEKSRSVYEKQIRLMEEKYKKQIRDIEHNNHVTFQQYKKEHENLVSSIMERAEEIKKDAAREKKKATETYKEAMAVKEKFSKLLFRVKTLYSGIDSIMKSTVVAETEIVTLINDLERDMSFRKIDEDAKETNVTPIKKNAYSL